MSLYPRYLTVPLHPDQISQAEEAVRGLEKKYGISTADFLEGILGTPRKIALPGRDVYTVPDIRSVEWEDREAWAYALDVLKVAGRGLPGKVLVVG